MQPQALQAIDRELRAEEAAAARAAADKKAQEDAAAAHKKVSHSLPQSKCASCVFQAEQLRRAEEQRVMEERRRAEVLHSPVRCPLLQG
jgi:hypothetical protein